MTMKINVIEDTLQIEIPLNENLDNEALQELQFQILAKKWKEEAKFLSFASEMAKLPSYQQIIAMGKAIVPFILKMLDSEPQHWFIALNAITAENPVSSEHKGDINQMTNDWLTWGKKNGYL